MVTIGSVEGHIVVDALARDAAWMLNDGVGTTSALFVISNRIRSAELSEANGQKLLVTTREVPICNPTLDDPAGAWSGLLFIAPVAQGATYCAEGFRIGLELDTAGTIHEVWLAVREP